MEKGETTSILPRPDGEFELWVGLKVLIRFESDGYAV